VEPQPLLFELLLLIAIAAIGAGVVERLRLPSIVGFLAAGALVGPGGFGIVSDPERVAELAELGVVFLLFEIGLELPVERVRRLWRRALLAGGLQVALTLGVVSAAAVALGVPLSSALVLGALVAMSSTALVMGLLANRGELDAPHGQLAVGILLFQDLCIVPFLLAVPLLAAASSAGGASVGLAAGRGVLALVVLFVGARLGLPRLLDRAARAGSRELFTLIALLVVLGSAVAAEFMGLTLAVGAFIGGLALSASPYSHQLFSEVVPLRGVLLGIFFTAIGMLLDVGEATRNAAGVATYVAFVVVFKAALVAGVIALVLRQGVRTGVLAGLALAQTGEFSFVLAAAASAAGLLEGGLQQAFLAGSVATLAATPFLVQAAPRAANLLARWIPSGAGDMEPEAAPLSDHVVLVGFGLAGQNVARVLRARDVPYVAVEANPNAVQEARARGEPIHYGDATGRHLVERLGVARAQLVVVAVSDPIATREIAAVVRRVAPDVEILARTRYVRDVDSLEAAGASAVIAEEFESTLELIAQALRHFKVPEGGLVRFTAGLREEGYELMRAPTGLILDPWLAELLEGDATEWVEVPDGYVGERSFAQLDLRARTGVNVVAVDRGGTASLNPPPSFVPRPGDRLLVLGTAPAVNALRELLDTEPTAPGEGA
jgi:CPA2 family monovalent cation:H+ antiporter-2